MLVQTEASGKGKVRADPNEHPTPLAVIQIEVVLLNPALFQLQMPAVFFLVSDRRHDACRFPALENTDDLVGLGPLEVAVDKVVPASGGSFQDRRLPFLGTILDPVMELRGNLAQQVAADRIELPVRVEETHHAFLLLKGLDDAVQQNAVETPIGHSNVMLMMLAKGVHGSLHLVRYLEA